MAAARFPSPWCCGEPPNTHPRTKKPIRAIGTCEAMMGLPQTRPDWKDRDRGQ